MQLTFTYGLMLLKVVYPSNRIDIDHYFIKLIILISCLYTSNVEANCKNVNETLIQTELYRLLSSCQKILNFSPS